MLFLSASGSRGLFFLLLRDGNQVTWAAKITHATLTFCFSRRAAASLDRRYCMSIVQNTKTTERGPRQMDRWKM